MSRASSLPKATVEYKCSLDWTDPPTLIPSGNGGFAPQDSGQPFGGRTNTHPGRCEESTYCDSSCDTKAPFCTEDCSTSVQLCPKLHFWCCVDE